MRRVGKGVWLVARLTGAALLLALTTSLGALLHLNLPCARHLAAAQVDTLLQPTFRGTVELFGIDRLRLSGIDGLHVRITDPEGVPVLLAQGVSARISAWGILRSALFGKAEIDVALSKIEIDHVDLNLDIAGDGVLRLIHAIEPREPRLAAIPPPVPAARAERGVRIALPDLEVSHAWIHGPVGGTPVIDVETLALRAAVFFQNKQATIDVAHVAFAARGLPQGLNPAGDVEAHIAAPSKTGRDIGVSATFAGVLGTIPLHLQGRMDGPQIEGTVDIPPVLSEQLRALVPAAPVFQPIGVHVDAHGELPTVEAVMHVTVGAGSVDVTAKLGLSDVAPTGKVHVVAEKIDARAFSVAAPPSDLGLVADASFGAKPGGPVAGTFSADVRRGKIAQQVVPHATLEGDFEIDPKALGGAKTVHAKGRVAEEGAPLDFSVSMRPAAGASGDKAVREIVSFAASSNVPSFPYVKRLASLPKGHGRLDVKGTVSLPDGSLDATATAEVGDVEQDAASVESVKLVATATGSLRAPVVASTLTVDGLRAGSVAFSHADGKTSGPLLAQKIDFVAKGSNTPDVELHAALDARSSLSASDVSCSLKRDGVTLRATAVAVHAADGGLRADGVVVQGLGKEVWGNVEASPTAIAIHGASAGVDLARVAQLFGLGLLVNGGELSFDVDFDARKDAAHGKIAVDVSRLSVVAVNEVSGHVEAQIEGRRITGTARATVQDVGTFEINKSTVDVGGQGPLHADSWRKAWGKLSLRGSLDLAKLADMLPRRALPVGEMSGQLYFEALAARDSQSDFTPELALSARTHGLVLAGTCASRLKKCSPWRSTGVDLQLDSDIDGESGFAELAVRAADEAGVIVALDAKSQDLPYAAMLSSDEAILPLLERTGVVATVIVPPRRLDKLPKVVPPFNAVGEVEATVQMTGSVVEPHLSIAAKGRGLRVEDAPASVAMKANVTIDYDGRDADAAIALQTPKEEVMAGSVKAAVPVEALLRGDLQAWIASFAAKVTRFPLAAFPTLQDHNVRGHVSGDLSVDDLHRDAKAALKVKVDDLQVGREQYSGGEIDVATDERLIAATARIAQPAGGIELRFEAGQRWGSALVPSLDDAESLKASLRAKHFQAAALRPLVGDALSELDGIVDGQASFLVIPKTDTVKMQGALTLDEGLLQLSSTGQEFHKVHARLTFSPDGVIRLEDVTALGLSGKLMASAVARINGTRLSEARLDVEIPKGHAIPLDVDGAEMGDIDGNMSVVATSPKLRLVNVDVQIPTMHVQLPIANTHNVESLEASPRVHVGVYKGKDPVPLALAAPHDDEPVLTEAASELDVSVHLGKDVEVKRGTQLKVALAGNPLVKVTNAARVSGQVVLKSGTLEVQGKRFEIEKGTVTWVGDDPTNPEAVVTAGWTAPDGTHVYADFIGPLKTGKVTLRSEPTLPNNEILALILFGTADGGTSNQAQNTGATGAAAASDYATQGLSQGLDELTGIEVKGRLDTSDSTNPKPEVEVQIARDISLQIAFVLGTPPPGQNTDRTLATIDWRFFRNWSLATTFGDAGSSMADVIWQYRY